VVVVCREKEGVPSVLSTTAFQSGWAALTYEALTYEVGIDDARRRILRAHRRSPYGAEDGSGIASRIRLELSIGLRGGETTERAYDVTVTPW
jgi:hypothetical protein